MIYQKKYFSSMHYLFFIGFISILAQVCLLRELNAAFFGIELIYILSFGIWLLGTAIGAAVGKRNFIPKASWIDLLIVITGILIIADAMFIRSLRVLFGIVASAYLPFDKQILSLLVSLLPVSFLTGLLFQWAAKKHITNSGTLPRAYAIESAGGIAGGVISTFVVFACLQNFTVIVICSLVSFLLVAVKIVLAKKKIAQVILPLILTIAAIFVLLLHEKVDLWSIKWNHPAAIVSEDTPYGRITISSIENQFSIFENDELVYESESVKPETFVFMSIIQNPGTKKILVLGGGYAGVINELAKINNIEIDYVELNERIVFLVKEHAKDNGLTQNHVRIFYEDPRKFLAGSGNYDIILIGAPDPNSILNNRFYTKEFFGLCKSKLNKRGIVSFIITSSENLWTPQLRLRNSSIYKTISSQFKNIVVLPGESNLFITSNSELSTNPATLTVNLESLNIPTRFVNKHYINYIFTNDRFFEIQKLLTQTNAQMNTDLKPICFKYTVSIWLSKFFPNIAFEGMPMPGMVSYLPAAGIVMLLFTLLFVFRKRFVLVRKVLLVFFIGFIGMVLETIIIINYQVKSGILYQNIGLLITMFMIGLAAGSFMIDRIITKTQNRNSKTKKWIGVSIVFGLSLVSLLYYLLISNSVSLELVGSSLFLILSGFFVSGVFAYASIENIVDQTKVVAPLYSADVLGGAVASVVVMLLLIPAMGIPGIILMTSIFSFSLLFIT
ncbi:MAG: hypothetical protein V1720_19685 [bacterium]